MNDRKPRTATYNRLEVDRILATAKQLEQRIEERFPGSGLKGIATELIGVAGRGQQRLDRLHGPLWSRRGVAIGGIVILVLLAVLAVVPAFRASQEIGSRADVFQATTAFIDELVLLGIAIVYLMGHEGRGKRSVALAALYELRSMAHVIDMHQLTKDPEHILYRRAASTESSLSRRMTRFELGRYLDYCSEMLSLVSKMAALHVQDLRDPVVLGAVRDVESLTGNLQNKIWQKKQILDASLARRVKRSAAGLSAARAESRTASEPSAANATKAVVQAAENPIPGSKPR
ncbi:MAG TPA: hypothetical protein VEY91_13875 [Candidatus Limnocylindria bacterium]|nr:hypothetical protein [Candidatus Limnocylindria bacterium]